jgi:glycosyltransferase involved in cell wall biosynthesis
MDRANPLVTVIIPSYNYGRFVTRAVDSVLRQTYSPIECIVVDDGSTDDTQARLEQYQGRVRIITQHNQGLSAARNTGMREATGSYLAFLDADDWWEPEKTEKQMVGAVGCGEYWRDERMRVWKVITPAQPFPDPEANLRAVAVRRLWIGGSGSGILARRQVFEAVGSFDTGLRASEDWDMWLRIVARFPIANLPDTLNNRAWHGTGSFRRAALFETNGWKVYRAAVQRWPQVLDARTRRQMRALIHSDAGGEHMFAREWTAALSCYWRSVMAWPLSASGWYILTRVALRAAAAGLRPGGSAPIRQTSL